MTPSFDPSPLISYMKSLGIEYHYLREPIVERAGTELSGDSLCAYCSRMKRGLLYACCRRHGYNKLVLAQHLDDLGESFLMSSFHNGTLRTMKANYLATDSGEDGPPVRVIRPLMYVLVTRCSRSPPRHARSLVSHNPSPSRAPCHRRACTRVNMHYSYNAVTHAST